MCAWKLFGKKGKSPGEMLANGNFKGALKGFEAELKEKGFNAATMLQVAGIYQKLGQPLEAKKRYSDVGDHYANLGFFNKSVTAFKKALAITPDDRGILERMASYNEQVPKYIIGQDLQRRINEEILQPRQEEKALIKEREEAEKAYQANAEKMNAKESSSIRVTSTAYSPQDDEETPDSPPSKASEYEDIQALSGDISAEFTQDQDKIIDATIGPVAPNNDESVVLDFSGIFHDPHKNASPSRQGSEENADDNVAMPTDAGNDQAEAKAQLEQSGGSVESAAHVDDPASQQPVKTDKAAAEVVSEIPLSTDESTKPPMAAEPTQQDETAAASASKGNRFVFSKQASQLDESDADQSKDFENFDDALDDIFSAPSQETSRQEENRRHWALFRTMPSDLFMDFVAALEMREFEGDALIVEQGGTGSDMFLIAEGEVDIYLEQRDVPTRVATLGEGDFFGEASLLTGQPRSATVRTRKPTSCLVLKRSQLKQLARSHPAILDSVKTIYYTRRKHNAALRR